MRDNLAGISMGSPVSVMLLMIAACTLAGCGGSGQSAEQAAPVVLDPQSYTLAQVRTLRSGPTLSGSIVPRAQAVLRAQVAGAVTDTYALPGQKVHAGELLVRLENRDLEQAVRSAQVAVSDAQSRLEHARTQRQRERTLYQAGAVARHDVEQAEEQASNAASALAQAQTSLAQARKQLAGTSVRAPFTGEISAKDVSKGDVVQVGASLYTLVDLSTNELAAYLPPGEAAGVHVGTPVDIHVIGRPERLHGEVTRVNPSTDPATRQVRIYASLGPKGGTLPAGLFAEGRAIVQRATSLAVPLDALEDRSDTPSAMVVQDGVIRRVSVSPGIEDQAQGLVAIRSGLRPGEPVLVGAARNLTAGMHVQLPEREARATTPAAAPERR